MTSAAAADTRPATAEGATAPTLIAEPVRPSVCRPVPPAPVGELPDEEREALIREAGDQLQAWLASYERSSCLVDRATADAWRLRMYDLIRGRRPEFVRLLEIRRGLI